MVRAASLEGTSREWIACGWKEEMEVGTRERAVMPGDVASCFSWGILFHTPQPP